MDSFFLDSFDDKSDLIPLLSAEDEKKIDSFKLPKELSILPLKNTVLFPGVVIPITVGRDKSIKLVKDCYKGKKIIGTIAQKKTEIDDPNISDLNSIGTMARIMRLFKMPDGSSTIIIQGLKRFNLNSITQTEPYFKGTVSLFNEVKPDKKSKNFKALVESVRDLSLKIIKESPKIPKEAAFAINNIESDSFLINFISSNINITVSQKQEMLEEPSLEKRTKMALKHLNNELKMLEMKNEIQSKVKSELDEQQREYLLNQQLKAIQEELGGNVHQEDIDKMRLKAKDKKWDKKTEEHFNKELKKLQRMNPQLGEFGVQRSYIETLLELPWNEFTEDHFDLNKAKKILNRDHFGLNKVKDRIIEYLAVLKLKGDMRSPIICLHGPPGVGKTSLGKSIAESLGREYIRMSLGGLRDQSEIRGHRKTYIGAMPGRVIQSIKRAKSSNPVFVLDEIDKLNRDAFGDPSAAMLEMLDPEQNNAFYDNYIEIGFDLSRVLFIATANDITSISAPLRDRMELIEVSGYTVNEKFQIGNKFLLKNLLKNHGLKSTDLKILKKDLEMVIENYTRESGVRGLERILAKLIRSVAKNIVLKEKYDKTLNEEKITKILGPKKFNKEKYQDNNNLGVVTGLAWTPQGGDILFIESSVNSGKGKLTITGNIGKVMQESSKLALEFLKSHKIISFLENDFFQKNDIHIHVPEGAIPKDGPSAGITMLTSLASLLSGKKVVKNLAMTGEITLRGKVLPVGGIKEKILAAKRAGIKKIILSKMNEKDILDIDPLYIKGLNFLYVDHMNEVLQLALI
ncbi:MAG: endopeptidase La [Flavobacteriales bacterium]|nr:endopeptidase La [Flavobacteriales bacterium]|tara:strand:- start:1925 stop:4321 length:2397 start_codon:yes stop_codon:yes gene_type:complete